jgi:predicted alpha/beta-fold hydrolase
MPIVRSAFRPAWWLPGPHLQTLWPRLMPTPALPPTRRERLELPDGDFVDVVCTLGDGPLVAVFHGLQGSVQSPYAAGLLAGLERAGLRAVLMHFRGCSGEPNRLPRAYHAGDTADIRHVVGLLRPKAAVGFSLGGNALLKYLGEEGLACNLRVAIAVSPPLVLSVGADRLRQGFSRLYQRHLLNLLKAAARRKQLPLPAGVDLERTWAARDFWQFDDAWTAPLHGFRNVHHYFDECSARRWLGRIAVTTHILHSRDDPFYTPAVLPTADELPPHVNLELSEAGGHVGFVQTGGRPWLDERIPALLRASLDAP